MVPKMQVIPEKVKNFGTRFLSMFSSKSKCVAKASLLRIFLPVIGQDDTALTELRTTFRKSQQNKERYTTQTENSQKKSIANGDFVARAAAGPTPFHY